MRGRDMNRCRRWHQPKRATLAAMLITALPATLGSPDSDLQKLCSLSAADVLSMPPLPLSVDATGRSSRPQLNPFCQPVRVDGLSPNSGPAARLLSAVGGVQLASGDAVEAQSQGDSSASTIRLVPIVIAPQIEPLLDPVANTIKANPLAASVADATFLAPTINAEPIVEKLALPTPPPSLPVVAAEIEPVVAPLKVAMIATPTVAVAKVEGPVSFSLSDEDTVETTKKRSTKGSFAAVVRGDEHRRQSGDPARPSDSLDRSASVARPVHAAKMILVPLPDATSQGSATAATSDARLVKGSRPRVDVGSLPLAIERAGSTTSKSAGPVASYAEAVATPGSKLASAKLFQKAPVESIALKRTEVRTLGVKGAIQKVQVENGAVCSVIAAGASQVQLIGTGDGVAHVAIWVNKLDGSGSFANQDPEVYEVRVGSAVRSDATDLNEAAIALSNSARIAIPGSVIQVRHEQGKMIVEGTCTSDESAKQALRMVRSACLMPVVDKLKVR